LKGEVAENMFANPQQGAQPKKKEEKKGMKKKGPPGD